MAGEKLTLTVTEAARTLGISRPTLYTLVHSEGFPAFQIGKRILISRSGLEEWVQEQSNRG